MTTCPNGGETGACLGCGTLRAVLLKRPGPELDAIEDFDAMQMRSDVLTDVARAQHDALVDAYRSRGVDVRMVQNGRVDKPNSFFIRI